MFPRELVAVSRNGALICAAAGKWGPFFGAPHNKGSMASGISPPSGRQHSSALSMGGIGASISRVSQGEIAGPKLPSNVKYCCSCSNTVRGSEARVPSFLGGLTLRWKFVRESANVQMMNFDSRNYDNISVEMSEGTEVLLDLVD
jgi:hypothetical protein